MDANRVEVSGTLARDAESLTLGESLKTKLRLASKRSFTRQDGSPGEETTYLTVGAWRELADASKGLKTGDRVLVKGRLRTFSLRPTAEGEKPRPRVEIEATSISKL